MSSNKEKLNTIKNIEWAIETIREQYTLGLDELAAAKFRERRAEGVLIDAREVITMSLECNYWVAGDCLDRSSTKTFEDCCSPCKRKYYKRDSK